MTNIGDKVDNTPGASGELTAAEFNDHKNCLQETVTSSAQSLSNIKTPNQLSRALFIYGTSAQSMQDTAPSANIIELTPITGASGLLTPDSYSQMDGVQVEFVKPIANSSNSVTVNFGQTGGTLLGAKSLKQEDGTNPILGQVQGRIKIQFDVGNDYWVLLSSSSIVQGTINDFVNGQMDFWQRNITFTGVVNGNYTADRIEYEKSGTMVHDILQSSDTPNTNFNFSFQLDCTTAQGTINAGDYIAFGEKIEGHSFKKFVNNFGVLGFWVKSSKSGIHCVSFRNIGKDRSYVVEYTVDSADTWEYKKISILFDETGGTWDYLNDVGIDIKWTLAVGSTFQTTPNIWQTGNFFGTSNQVNVVDNIANDFRITGITFNLGTVPVGLNSYDYLEELTKCQRYYEKNYDLNVFPGTSTGTSSGTALYVGASVATTVNYPSIAYKTRKRTTSPTITTYSLNNGTSFVATDYQTATDFAANTATIVITTETEFIARNNSGGTINPTYDKVGFNWVADDEL